MSDLSKLSRSVDGHVVIVTGAASGMGRAEAMLFAAEGARVAVTDVNEEGARGVADEISAAGKTAKAWKLDVSDPTDVTRVVGAVVDAFGGVDVLVNNAGIAAFETLDSDEYEGLWERTLDVNLTGEMRMVRACLPHLHKSDAGRIINIASTEGLGATALNSAYVAAKHGVVGLTRGLAVELGRTNITVNCICPGPIITGMTAVIPDDAKQKFARRRVPARRYGVPEEVAHAVLSLALPASSFINGVALPVDGGLLVQNT
jgi:3-oxoacyl-[acyl-carrier protein] reductase